MKKYVLFFTCCLLAMSALSAKAELRPVEPFMNGNLADSTYPIIHARAGFSPVAGPVGPSRPLGGDEVVWQPVGPINGYLPIYSAPYPNGKRVVWVGGYDRVAKLDADTLETLTTYAIGGNTFFGDDEIRHYIAKSDALDDEDLVKHNLNLWPKLHKHAISAYRLLNRANELYLLHRGGDGAISLRAYGEVDGNDPASAIELRREWRIPAEISAAIPFSVNMTSDGWLILAMSDGVVIALSQDFKHYSYIQLPGNDKQGDGGDIFATFVRNGVVTDDRNGIYMVTRAFMHRLQWTGSKLSTATEDGAWQATYSNELGVGSGTTPALMGWGEDEDHLVVIADSAKSNNLVGFWRDKIPDDWQGLPGQDRRIAAIEPIHFSTGAYEQTLIENTPIVYGYGVFFDNTRPVQPMPDQGGPGRQWLAESFSMHVPGHEALGGTMIRWDAAQRKFATVWQSQTNFVSTVCTVSGATETIYCWGARNRQWTLEGTDWNTGKSTFHYTLGKSHRFNPLGGMIVVAPNGAIDCGCTGGMGLVRVKPEIGKK